MSRKILALVMILTLAMTGTMGAAQNVQGFVVRGMGALGCQTLVSGLKGGQNEDASARLIAWLSGYVTYANRAAAGVGDVLPFASIEGLATVVVRVCANNTQAQVEVVTASVLNTLKPLAVVELEKALELRQGEVAIMMRPSVLRSIQEHLIARELLPKGTADGIYSVQTAEAVGKFQKQSDITPTGLPDAWTVFLLQAAR